MNGTESTSWEKSHGVCSSCRPATCPGTIEAAAGLGGCACGSKQNYTESSVDLVDVSPGIQSVGDAKTARASRDASRPCAAYRRSARPGEGRV